MDLRQLTYFLAIVDHGGFGRAARELHVAQPSLSQAMRGAERQLGFPLFRRAGRGVVLTDAGHAMVEPARQVQRDLQAAEDAARSVHQQTRGHVDIASMPSPAIEPLATILSEFLAAYPGLTVRVDGSFSAEEAIAAVRSGTAEVALIGEARRRPVVGLEVIELEDQPLILVSPASATFRSTSQVEPDELAGLTFIASPVGSLMREVVDEVIASGGGDARIAVEVAHRTAMLALARRGVGHAVMPAAWTVLVGAGTCHRELTPKRILRTALVHRRDGLTPASKALLDTVKRVALPSS